MQFYYRHFDQQIGPASWETLVEKARSGALYPTDLIWAEGWPAWQEARLVQNLFPAAAPPPVPAAAPGAPAISPYALPQGDDGALMRALLPVGRSPWAIIAGYFGIFSLLLIPAPVALLTGILAVRDIRKNPRHHGMGRAVFAIVMGSLGCLMLIAIGLTFAFGGKG